MNIKLYEVVEVIVVVFGVFVALFVAPIL